MYLANKSLGNHFIWQETRFVVSSAYTRGHPNEGTKISYPTRCMCGSALDCVCVVDGSGAVVAL